MAFLAVVSVVPWSLLAPSVHAAVEVSIPAGDTWRYLKGTAEPPADWATVGFDDSGWNTGPSGFGYGDNDDATVLSDMRNGYMSLYLRKAFSVANPAALTSLTLTVDYDDGFVAYLNGVEVARANVSGTPPAFNTPANGEHEASGGGTNPQPAGVFNLTPFLGVLVAGANVLALQGHNQLLNSSDFSLIPSLLGTSDPPTAPSGLTATVVSAASISLAWLDNSTNEASFEIEVASSPAGPFAPLVSLAANSTSYIHSGLSSGTQYCYQARAVNGAGASAFSNVSCATTQEVAPAESLPIVAGDTWRYLKGTAEPPATWMALGFDDSAWASGPSGFGYGDNDDATVLSDMQNRYMSLYIRKTFSVEDPSALTRLTLKVDYDDGFVAYVNGVEVARANISGSPPAFNTPADSEHEASGGGTNPRPVGEFDLTPFVGALVAGTNVLAIQGHNQLLSSSDFSLIPSLESSTEPPPPPLPIQPGDAWRYFKGTVEPPANWTAIGFNDSAWDVGPSGFGYGDNDDATVLADMQGNYLTVYARKLFTVDDPATITTLLLRVDYDDGFRAFLNGTEVVRANVPVGADFNTQANSPHEASAGDTDPQPVAQYDLTTFVGLLVPGTNVLAIQGHNATISSTDFSLIPSLLGNESLDNTPIIVRQPYLQVPEDDSMTVVWATRGSGAPLVQYSVAQPWAQVGFDDSSWPQGPSGFGFADGDDATVLSDMQNNYLAVYLRNEFTVADPSAVTSLVLRVDYDDGFVAFLNGSEIARDNVSGAIPSHLTPANIDHEASGGNTSPQPVGVFDLTNYRGLLVAGTNVLAIEGHNRSIGSSDFSLIPSLEMTVTGSDPVTVIPVGAIWRYFKGTVEPGVPAPETAVAGTPTFFASLGGHYQYEVTLTGLQQATYYTYRVFLDGADLFPTETLHFRTAPRAHSGPVTFLAFGDSGSGTAAQRSIRDRMLTESFDLAVNTGDIAYNSGTYSELQSTYFDVYSELLKRQPIMVVAGNHDYDTASAQALLDFFVLPTNGTPGRTERYYSFDYGDIHFVALDTEIIDQTQADWLAADLAATDRFWKIVFLHRPLFGEGSAHPISESGAVAGRGLFGPIFEAYGVDMVLEGHNHNYGRSVPLTDAQPGAPYGTATTVADGGVVYVTTGGGGYNLYPAYTDSFHQAPDGVTFSDFHYVKLVVTGCTLSMQAIDRLGVVRDAYAMDRCDEASAPPQTTTVVQAQVSSSADDAYGTPTGWPGYSDADTSIFAGYPGSASPTWGGWRWTGLGIPAGAVVTKAYVELNQSGWGYQITTTLALEDSSEPGAFSAGSDPADRWADRTASEFTWEWGKATPGSWIRTPSLVPAVQELVDKYGGVDSLALLESGEGVTQGQYHSWVAYDGNPSLAARIYIEYKGGAPDTEAPSQPQDLVGTPVESDGVDLSWSASTDNLRVTAYRVYRDGVLVRTVTATSVSDTGLSPSTSYTYEVSAIDGAGNESLKSNVINVTTGVAPISVDVQVSSSADDAYSTPSGWPGYSSTNTVVYAGANGGNGPQWGGWRWTGLDIPAGAVITNAYVELNQSGWGYQITTTLAFEDSASPAAFSAGSTPTARWADRTTAEVTWSWGKATPGTWIRTPSLALAVQELVDTYGGLDSVVLLESGEGVPQGQYHSWVAYDGDPSLAAKLHIEYTIP